MRRLTFITVFITLLIGFDLIMTSQGASIRRKRHSPVYYELQRRLRSHSEHPKSRPLHEGVFPQEDAFSRPSRAGFLQPGEGEVFDNGPSDRRPLVRGTRPSHSEGMQDDENVNPFFSEW